MLNGNRKILDVHMGWLYIYIYIYKAINSILCIYGDLSSTIPYLTFDFLSSGWKHSVHF